jgi:hypothetical protein
MNIYKSLIFIASLMMISMGSYGQKWKNDPSYSIHNYKHPNKAEAAKKTDTARLKEILYVKALVPVRDNYKAQNLVFAKKQEMVQVISLTSHGKSINRNYKQQFTPCKRKD